MAIPKNSVGATQLKKSAVTSAKIHEGAVASVKVRDHSLLAKDFKTGQLPVGPQGPTGDTGAKGDTGTVDTSNFFTKTESNARYVGQSDARPFAWGQVSSTTTTTTTEGSGTITSYTPGSTIVLKETTGPRTYRFGKTVTYVTRSGKVLDEDTVRTRIKVGVPVHVHYLGEGDSMMVDRVVLDED